jgi:hypothetical protein
MIHFSWQDVTYKVEDRAYDDNLIQLPDGVVLQADGWLESMPPQPTGLRTIDPNFADDYTPPMAEVVPN